MTRHSAAGFRLGIGERIESGLLAWRRWRRIHQAGAAGDFYRAGGQPQLYEDLPIGTGELVIDGGGYRGEWTDELLCRYGCRSIVVEPIPSFSTELRRRYAHNANVEVIEGALANRSGQMQIAFANDGSSLFRDSKNRYEVQLIDFARLLRDRGLPEIACLKLNIEGGEYDVLERLLDEQLIATVRSLVVQFHRVDEQSIERRNQIQRSLSATHATRFDYPFMWECWIRRC